MKKVILVTGFGSFGDYVENPSWLAVKKLHEMGIETDDFLLVIQEVPVSYETVKKTVPMLWKEYNPELVIHVGVSAKANCITLEECAHNCSYNLCDVNSSLPEGNVCKENGEDCIHSKLDLKIICTNMNENYPIKATISNDAGRYLCEYIYYMSLCENDRRTLFIHVPPENKPYTITELAEGLRFVINDILKQIK
ncbi:unnamed protein product [Dimorphilus gyrociliatus]|uniref:Uncharacterized protein n=1 Tax=Dimorphilus gyrociliatus TaxID=2664684 RepID=A0A7I8VEW2_9ANNE|nr:unnamed protein product [Dimorphilus gyrociliatus]